NRPSPTPRTITISTSTTWSSCRRMSARRWCSSATCRAHAAAPGRFSSRSRTSPSWCVRSRRRPKRREKNMGQKVNPIGLRLGINRTWDSRWFAGKTSYGSLLHEDMKIREALMKELKQAAVSKIVIERPHKKCRVTIHSARPGVVIGKKGADIEKLRRQVAKLTDSDVVINIV